VRRHLQERAAIAVLGRLAARKAHAVQEFCGPVSLGEGNRSLIYVVNNNCGAYPVAPTPRRAKR
jgi:hypothetical protein